jgi:hypothetical protein
LGGCVSGWLCVVWVFVFSCHLQVWSEYNLCNKNGAEIEEVCKEHNKNWFFCFFGCLECFNELHRDLLGPWTLIK